MNTIFKKVCLTEDINELYDIFEQKHKEREYYFLNKYGKTYVELFNERELVLFGAGMIGSYIAIKLKKIKKSIAFFCDNNRSKWGTVIDGIEIKSPQYLIENKNKVLVLITVVQSKDIQRQLDELGIDYMFYDIDGFIGTYNSPSLYHNKEKVISAFNLFDDSVSRNIYLQYLKARFFPFGDFDTCGNIFLKSYVTGLEYFDREFFKYSDNEIMLDIGACEGDTIAEFKKFMLEMGKSEPFVYAFEPDKDNCKSIIENMEYLGIKEYKLFNNFVGNDDKKSENRFFNNCNNFIGNENVNACKLDTEMKDIDVTFFKADVEGYEIDVLKGASEIIKTKSPKLAICVYHLTHHLFEIPLYIKKLNCNYKLFLRMHENNLRGLICYAYVR